MIRRKGKLKKSKQGSLLIIVVLILALAIIFISSAMMLTQATKDRLYDNAMSSQARLTVTAASEAFIEALETQEINDDQFDLLISDSLGHAKIGQHGNSDKIKMLVDGVPGMSSSPDNCTYVDIYFPTAADVNKVAHMDFTTVIGDEVENVKIILDINDVKNVNPGNGFTNQIEVASNVSVTNIRFPGGLGMYDADLLTGGSPDDNTVLLRDNYYEQNSQNNLIFSDIVVAGSDTDKKYFAMGEKALYAGDIIFMDNAYLSTHASNDWGFTGDFYFLGKEVSGYSAADYDAGTALWKDGGWDKISNTSRFIFSNRVPQRSDVYYKDGHESDNGKIQRLFTTETNANRAYFVDKNGNSLTSISTVASTKVGGGSYNVKNSTLSSSTMSNSAKYTFDGDTVTLDKQYTVTDKTNYYQNSYRTNIGSFPTATDYFKSVDLGDDELTTEYPYATTDAKYKNLNTTLGTMAAGGIKDLAAGNYIITASLKAGAPGTGVSPYIIALNGAKEYRFYFADHTSFEIENVVFAMYNVSESTIPPIFVLEDGAEVYLGGTTEDTHHQDTNAGFCSSGFLSMNRGINSAAALKTYIHGKKFNAKATDGGEAVAHVKKVGSTSNEYWSYKKDNGTDGDPIYYSKFYDGVHRPNLYVFGVSSNTFRVSFGTIIEGYIGIFGGGSFGIMNTKKDNGKIIPIYGRIMASKFTNGGDTPAGTPCMPYCPQPAGSNKINPVRPAVTKYHVTDVIYYYD